MERKDITSLGAFLFICQEAVPFEMTINPYYDDTNYQLCKRIVTRALKEYDERETPKMTTLADNKVNCVCPKCKANLVESWMRYCPICGQKINTPFRIKKDEKKDK